MSLTTYLVRGFEHRHENQMFADLVGALEHKFGSTPNPHLLIGNVMIEGSELDALFLTTRGICILEMKAHGGKVQFRENVPWTVGASEVRGGTKENPFLQVRAYRMAVRNFFGAREKEILVRERGVYWQHICAMVLFGNPVQDDFVWVRGRGFGRSKSR